MTILTIIQTILGVLLIITIVLQNRGAGLGSTWGGSGEFYITRRGFDKLFFKATITTAILFVLVSFGTLIYG